MLLHAAARLFRSSVVFGIPFWFAVFGFATPENSLAVSAPSVLADIHEGLNYLRAQPAVLALGVTYACMMAGVISANVLVVALANNLLHVGARGYGFIESGWALGAVLGGFGGGSAFPIGVPFVCL